MKIFKGLLEARLLIICYIPLVPELLQESFHALDLCYHVQRYHSEHGLGSPNLISEKISYSVNHKGKFTSLLSLLTSGNHNTK